MVVMTALQRGIVNENTVLNNRSIPGINAHEIKDVARHSAINPTSSTEVAEQRRCIQPALAMPSPALVDTSSRFRKATNLG